MMKTLHLHVAVPYEDWSDSVTQLRVDMAVGRRPIEIGTTETDYILTYAFGEIAEAALALDHVGDTETKWSAILCAVDEDGSHRPVH